MTLKFKVSKEKNIQYKYDSLIIDIRIIKRYLEELESVKFELI